MKAFIKKGVKGQTSIFLCIVLLSVTALAGVLTDVSRIAAGEVQVNRAASLAAKSALAGYSSRLKNEYGIFAANGESMEAQVKKYLQDNLASEQDSFQLYGFRVENVKVTPVFNLTENEVTRSQILEYMKFRAPKELVEGIIERLDAVKQSGKMAGAYKRKIAVDKLTGKLGKYQEALKRNICGTLGKGNIERYFINSFNTGNAAENVILNIQKTADNLASTDTSITELEIEISALEKSGKPDKKELEKLKNEKAALEKEKAASWENIKNSLNLLKSEYTVPYIKTNQAALNNIQKILDYGEKIKDALATLESFMNSAGFAVVAVSGDFVKTMQEDIQRVKEIMLDGEKAQQLLDSINNNLKALDSLIACISQLEQAASKGDYQSLNNQQTYENLRNLLKGYDSSLVYDYILPEKGASGEDSRDTAEGQAEELLTRILGEDISLSKAGINPELLPSQKKVESEGEQAPGEQNSGNEYDKLAALPMNTSGKFELDNEDSSFAEDSFGFLDSIGSSIAARLSDVRDEVYINEYVMGSFKNAVLEVKDGSTAEKLKDLRGKDMSGKETFFNNEVEYVLNGNQSDRINSAITKGEILLMRFVLNTLHVYSDPKKRELSEGIAAAVSGWWSAGAAIPVVSNLIRCGWGLGEAVLDMNELMAGRSVPFYKLKGDWRLDINGFTNKGGTKSDPRLSFSYHDYLRLFLLLENPDIKMNRIEDLIELNIAKSKPGFKMSGYNTYVKIEAEVSMRYLFITGGFMPRELKTEDGRHVFKVRLYEGY